MARAVVRCSILRVFVPTVSSSADVKPFAIRDALHTRVALFPPLLEPLPTHDQRFTLSKTRVGGGFAVCSHVGVDSYVARRYQILRDKSYGD